MEIEIPFLFAFALNVTFLMAFAIFTLLYHEYVFIAENKYSMFIYSAYQIDTTNVNDGDYSLFLLLFFFVPVARSMFRSFTDDQSYNYVFSYFFFWREK